MKKHLFSIMLLTGSLMAFMGCGKDDGNKPGNDASIAGTWKHIQSVDYTTVDGTVRVGPETDDVSGENAALILKEDKTFQTTWQGSVDDEGHYTYANGKLILNFAGGDVAESKVKTLDNHTLVLSYEDDDSGNGHTIIEVTEDHYTR